MKLFLDMAPANCTEPVILLTKSDWNDWFTWYTLYSVQLINVDGTVVHLGRVKIGQRGMSVTNASTKIETDIAGLDESYFSLGQDENYYETLISLGEDIRKLYLNIMRDCAFLLDIFEKNLDEPVMQESLLRDVEESRVRERFHRLANGQAILTYYSFEYHFPEDGEALTAPPVLTFAVSPNSLPATNIHVLIGRNGVGKSRCFDFLARTFLGMPKSDSNQGVGKLVNTARRSAYSTLGQDDPGFAGLVTVSFSAFDSRGPLTGISSGAKKYEYIGLVTHKTEGNNDANVTPSTPRVKGSAELAAEFAESVVICREGIRRRRWKQALTTLESDSLFAESSVSRLADDDDFPGLDTRARDLFLGLSSGHAIVLLTITRLVELVEEKSLVLIDEPESHLHPPLLSAFLRTLSDLLTDRNGVAIIATHSPVVLQEVPKSCVWMFSRAGHEVSATRPEIETFGENVGILTREVFGLEVTQTGFHRLVADKVQGRTYDSIMKEFGGQLGAEGRALARALSILPPDSSVDEEAGD